MATLDQAIEQMYAAGMPTPPGGQLIVDGERHRYGPKGYGAVGRAYYKLYEYPARNGRRYISGYFGRWGEIDTTKIRTDFSGIEPDELRRLQQSQAAQQFREREKRAERARFAANRARQQWQAARARLAEGETCAYLARKRLQWENGLRLAADGTLLVPMVRYDVTEAEEADPAYTGPRRLAGLQKIAPDGTKKFNRGADPVGAACRFGKKPKDGDLLLVGEGLATVLSAHQVLERAYSAFVAFTAGNLVPVARILRALYPKSPILFLADDDAYLEAQLNARLAGDYGVESLYKVLDAERTMDARAGPVTVQAHVHDDARGTPVLTAGITVDGRLRTLVLENAGRAKAWEASATASNAWVAWPRFAARELAIDPAAPRLTDWNDLHVVEGIERIAAQLGEAIRAIEEAHELARALAEGAPAAADAPGGGGTGGSADEPDWQLHGNLLRRFILVFRSDTAFDEEGGHLWRVSHMRLAFGGRPVAMWLASKRRRAVDLSQVVFDPRGSEDSKTTVNLFRGLETKPGGAGKCAQLLKLLRYLCGEDEATYTPVSDWVLRWCAYQVQHVGAKMKTAIVMYGPEGTGKNLFWSAMQEIFGRYAALIGQSELEDKHNTWLSAKLFLIANEVVTRAEMSHHVGRLKNLVTEPWVYINPKMIDQRYERNFVNLVFLSNEFQPLKISLGDRRYMVIRTPSALPEAFYRECAAEIEAGGAAAFMRHLLELDLEGFGEHTKPLVTEAKRDLIELGMLPSQLFWQELKEGLVPLPYCPALADDVYRAYAVWCARRGHKTPEAQNRFTPAFMSMNGVRRVTPQIPDPDRVHELALVDDSLPRRRVFLMGSALGNAVEERQRVLHGVSEFRRALKDFIADDARSGLGDSSARHALR